MPLDIPVLATAGLCTVAALYVGKLARRVGLPSLIGYMAVGAIAGSSVLGLLEEPAVESLGFITEVALGFVAFTIGSELNFRQLSRLGRGIGAIIVIESLLAFGVVLGATYALTGNLPLALVFGAMAPASAPAGTVAVIQEYRARGSLTKALYAIVGFDDGLAVLIFGFAAALAKTILAGGHAGGILSSMLVPLREIVLSLAGGGLLGWIYTILVRRLRPHSEIPALTFGFVAIIAGMAAALHLSLILTAMMLGMVLTNFAPSASVKRSVEQLRSWMPLIFILFFVLAGAHLHVSALPSLGLLGAVYITARSAGLIGGAWLGGKIGGAQEKIRRLVGLGILSQAGVAIGLSLIVKQDLASVDPNAGTPQSIGAMVITTVTATCVFFEIVGPILAKIALQKAGEIRPEKG